MNKEVLKNLLVMMQSNDVDNHYMAMQAIINLGDPNTVTENYKEELLFLWLYGKSEISDWASINDNIAKLYGDLISRYKPKMKSYTASYKSELKLKERWLGHMIGTNTRIKKPWIAELIIEEMINEKKSMFKALDFKYKEIQVNIVQ
jgi:hypothetical protein